MWGIVEMASWQPIATAPKDGTSILAYQPSTTLYEIENFYYETYAVIEWTKWGWQVSGVGGYEYETDINKDAITHWMPLPERPDA